MAGVPQAGSDLTLPSLEDGVVDVCVCICVRAWLQGVCMYFSVTPPPAALRWGQLATRARVPSLLYDCQHMNQNSLSLGEVP